MFDLGMSEMLVIGIVALIVVGPKDLPGLFRNVGRFVGKAKGMARDFSRAMNDAADETGIKDVAKGLKAATKPVGTVMDSFKDATDEFTSGIDPTKYDPESETGKLAADRADNARKIQASTARAAATRKAREADEALAKAEEAEAAATRTTTPKTKPAKAAKPKTTKPKAAQPKAAKPKTAKPKPAKAQTTKAKPPKARPKPAAKAESKT